MSPGVSSTRRTGTNPSPSLERANNHSYHRIEIITTMADNTYDAIVIGSGISGGWAAKELTEKGLKTIMLERGRNFEHIKDYKTANLDPWDFPHRGAVTQAQRAVR